MVSAKPISLRVRPTQSADLCFPVNGVIEFQPEDLLGRSVNAFDLAGLKNKLQPEVVLPSLQLVIGGGGPLTIANPVVVHPGGFKPRTIGDGPAEIEGDLGRSVLSRLSAMDIATGLTQALAWFGLKDSADLSREAIQNRTQLLGNNPTDSNSLPGLLSSLSNTLRKQHDVLDGLYQDAGTDAVPASPPNYHSSGHSDTTGGQSFHTETTNDTTYDGQEYRSLQAENHARYLRAEIGLRKERLAAYRLIKMNSATNVDYAKAMTTADVRKIQLSYIDTFLVAPFDGVITAVFRNVGDFVTAGQPVLRLENDQTVYLVGQIKCRGLIRLGDPAHISTTLFGIPAEAEAEIDGTVCAIRGHEPIDEQWNVVIRCSNETPDGRALPLNYNFDFDNTQISLGV